MKKPLITSGQDWSFALIEEVLEHIDRIAKTQFRLDTYTNQIEVIASEQMLDAYTSVGLPVHYSHWSFGEQFVRQQEMYRRGQMGLAYEIVINSNPCIAYLMEENTMLMQTLVMAHASYGHNHFFKNNYLFKMWTDADGILDYLVYAKQYIRQCEEQHGVDAVEAILDAAHSLQHFSVDKYKRPTPLSAAQEKARQREREQYIQSQLNEIWNTIPAPNKLDAPSPEEKWPKEPEENILYWIEKHAPRMETWQREIIRIVRKLAQYFYPQMQTKVMNEGCATYFHYRIIHALHEEGIIDNGAMLEFYESHTNVVAQPGYDNRYFNGINPYALGFAMMQDIERVASDPTEEDRQWFRGAEWVGCGDPIGAILYACKHFKDESFIQQYLSPKVIRDFKLFMVIDDEDDPKLEIGAIHNESGYRRIRSALAAQYTVGNIIQDIQVTNVDRWGNRMLTLTHFMRNGIPLEQNDAIDTLRHVSYLWGYNVRLDCVDENKVVKATISIEDDQTTLDVFLDDSIF